MSRIIITTHNWELTEDDEYICVPRASSRHYAGNTCKGCGRRVSAARVRDAQRPNGFTDDDVLDFVANGVSVNG